MKKLLLIGLLAMSGLAHALEVAGVRFDDTTRLGAQELQLNGAGCARGFSSRSMRPGCICLKRRRRPPMC